MDGNEITHGIDVLDPDHVGDLAAQMPGGIDGNIGVIAVDIHAQVDGRVGDADTDGAQTDDTDLLALQLDAGKLFLFLFRCLGDIGIVPVGTDPVDALDDVAGGQEHAGKDQLLDAVRVGTGGVEHDDSLLSAALEGNVVDAGTCAGDGQQVVGELHIVHGCAAHQDAVGILDVAHLLIFGGEVLETDGGNVVEAVKFIHNMFSL